MARLKEKVRRLLAGVEEEDGFVAAAPAMPVREVFRRFWPFARPYRLFIPLILLFAALGPAIEAATIWMYKILVDEVLVPQNFGLLLWVVPAYAGLSLAEGIVGFCDETSPIGSAGASSRRSGRTSSRTCKGSPWGSSSGGAWGT